MEYNILKAGNFYPYDFKFLKDYPAKRRPVVFQLNKNLRTSCDFSTSNHHKNHLTRQGMRFYTHTGTQRSTTDKAREEKPWDRARRVRCICKPKNPLSHQT